MGAAVDTPATTVRSFQSRPGSLSAPSLASRRSSAYIAGTAQGILLFLVGHVDLRRQAAPAWAYGDWPGFPRATQSPGETSGNRCTRVTGGFTYSYSTDPNAVSRPNWSPAGEARDPFYAYVCYGQDDSLGQASDQ